MNGKHSCRPPSLNLILTNSSANFAKNHKKSQGKFAICKTYPVNYDLKVELSSELGKSLLYHFRFWYFMAKMQLFHSTNFKTLPICEF